MQTDEKEKIIMEHVLGEKKKENLEMALDIISMTQKIREEIIKTFLKELKGFIYRQPAMSQWDWKKELYKKPYGGNSHRSFGVCSKFNGLPEPVDISLLGNPTGNNLYIGVFSSPKNELFNNSVDLSQLIIKFGASENCYKTESKIWLWYQSLKSPEKSPDWNYADWTNKDILIEMHTNPKRVVKNIGKHLLRIIEVAKPVIEEWVEQNPPAQ